MTEKVLYAKEVDRNYNKDILNISGLSTWFDTHYRTYEMTAVLPAGGR
jgi:hypothetical protein